MLLRFSILPLIATVAALGFTPSAVADEYNKLVRTTPLVCDGEGGHNISKAYTTRLGANNLRFVCMLWGEGVHPQAYLEVYHVTNPAYVPRQGMTKWRYDLHVGYAEYTMTNEWTWELPTPPRVVATADKAPSGAPTKAAEQPQQDSPTDEPSDEPETPVGDPEDEGSGNNGGGNSNNNGNNGGGSSCNNGLGNGGDGCDPGNSGGTPNGGQDD